MAFASWGELVRVAVVKQKLVSSLDILVLLHQGKRTNNNFS
tara:strand:+ start:1193 stop:1315 length:123 start_codon:yes stop_codon:yes gene_type:complete